MNDNCHDYACMTCGKPASIAYKVLLGSDERQPVSETERNFIMREMGWRPYGENWLCDEHRVRSV